MNQKGLAPILIVLLVATILIGVAIYRQTPQTPNPSAQSQYRSTPPAPLPITQATQKPTAPQLTPAVSPSPTLSSNTTPSQPENPPEPSATNLPTPSQANSSPQL